jgi:hypothetical protein
MIELLDNLPENTVAFTTSGKVTGDDYETVLIPALEAKLKDFDKVRLLYQLGEEFAGFEAEAMWDDALVGMKHLVQFEKIAVVSDVTWVVKATKSFAFMMPCEVKVFGNSELPAAKAWIAQ